MFVKLKTLVKKNKQKKVQIKKKSRFRESRYFILVGRERLTSEKSRLKIFLPKIQTPSYILFQDRPTYWILTKTSHKPNSNSPNSIFYFAHRTQIFRSPHIFISFIKSMISHISDSNVTQCIFLFCSIEFFFLLNIKRISARVNLT